MKRLFFLLLLCNCVVVSPAQNSLKQVQFIGQKDFSDLAGDFTELSDGTMILMWTSYRLPSKDTCFINARKIAENGNAGMIMHLDSFPIPPNTAFTVKPVAFPDKSFGYVFAAPQGSLMRYNLFFSRYTMDGKAIVRNLRVDTLSTGAALFASLTVDKNGKFAVAWEQNVNGQNDIMFRLFDKNNKPVSAPIAADPCSVCSKSSVQAEYTNGKLVLAWKKSDEIAALRINFRVFGSNGKPLTDVINPDPRTETGLVTFPRLKLVSKNEFAVAWIGRMYFPDEAEMNGIKDSAKIYIQLFGFDGKAKTPRIKVNTSCCMGLYPPEISVMRDTLFISWSSNSEYPGFGVYAWKYSLKKKTASTELLMKFDKQGSYYNGTCRAGHEYRFFAFHYGKPPGAAQETLSFAFTEKKKKEKKKEKAPKEKKKKGKKDEEKKAGPTPQPHGR
jgi:hypothetical protein